MERLWSEKHRGSLHDPDSWSSRDISLTYCGSGSGFFGQEQMKQYCGLYPSHLHSLHESQLARFDNKLETLTLIVDESKQMLVEECILSLFHHEPADWLAPSVTPCKRQIEVPLTFIVKFDGDLLFSVRVQWDQAMLLKQVSAFTKVINGRPSDAEEAFNQLPILTIKQACQRLRSPSVSNSCPLNPLSEANRPASKNSKKTVLDGMKSLLTDLPDAPITPARHRKLPALESKVFRPEDSCPQTPLQPKRIHASQSSNIQFDDSVQIVKPTGGKLVDNIFAPGNDAEQGPLHKDMIKINPNRLESHVFDQEAKFVPSVTLDPERLKSHIFDEDAPVAHHSDARSGLVSHIFDSQDNDVFTATKNNSNESHFEIGDNVPGAQVHKTIMADRNCDSHFSGSALSNDTFEKPKASSTKSSTKCASHFHGTTFDLDLEEPKNSVATKPTQNFVFKSSINFGDDPATCVDAPRQTNTKNQSQVCFDDGAEMPKAVSSIRADPTRGKSQIIF